MNKDDMDAPINEGLSKLDQSGRIPFHMPGHKRKIKRDISKVTPSMGPLDAVKCMDITEITGYDDLHHPQGMIRKSMDRLKSIYHTKESWYLVNGSTAGILAAICAALSPGDKILIGRNCHKSVYNAVRILQLKTVYLYPAISHDYGLCLDYGQKERKELQRILAEEGDIRAVVITSPTYEGVVSDISAIRKVISDYDDRIPLIVDEAHGAHMIYHTAFPKSAVECGADLVVQSLHKTLPALTQTALLHLCSSRVSADTIFDWLSVYETSSPSYVLMASAEESVLFMNREKAEIGRYIDRLYTFREACKCFSFLHLLESSDLPVFDLDIGKLVFVIKSGETCGSRVFSRLRDEWNLELEMAGGTYVLAMTSVMDEDRDFRRLWEGLQAIDQELADRYKKEQGVPTDFLSPCNILPSAPKMKESWECMGEHKTLVPLEKSGGRIAAAYVMVYPPGIPLLVPGEKIVKEMVEKLMFYVYNGYNVLGLSHGMIPVTDP